MPRSRRRAANLLSATLEAQVAALTVLGLRVPTLLDGTATAAEKARMVREKLDAFAESTQAMGQATLRTMAGAGGRAPTPATLASAWLDVAEAGARPYHTRLRSNAKRLRRASSP